MLHFLSHIALSLSLVSGAAETVLAVSPESCAWLVDLADRDAADYQPGVDIHGNAVAPADLGPKIEWDGENFLIPIELDLARRLGLFARNDLIGDALVGFVTVEGGTVYFNGQPITDPFAAELARLCAAAKP